MNILLVENSFIDLVKSRFPLGEYFQSKGNTVFYACPNPTEDWVYNLPMSRSSLAPIQLIKAGARLHNYESKNSVEVVLSFRFIPNVLNYLASFRNRSIRRIAVITGLGYAFISTNNSVSAIIQRALIKMFYRIASHRVQIIAQNPDDLIDLGVKNGKVILGSGVASISRSPNIEVVTDTIKLLFVGRLLKSKGIRFSIEVFEKLKRLRPDVTLTIAGTVDSENPDSINEIELKRIRKLDGVNYLGFVENMDTVYAKCNVLMFPSIYREGVPRVILESLKNGLTIVTREMPGCKETVVGNGMILTGDSTITEVIDYLMHLERSTLLENQNRSVTLFEKSFRAEVIYPQYLRLIVNTSDKTGGG